MRSYKSCQKLHVYRGPPRLSRRERLPLPTWPSSPLFRSAGDFRPLRPLSLCACSVAKHSLETRLWTFASLKQHHVLAVHCCRPLSTLRSPLLCGLSVIHSQLLGNSCLVYFFPFFSRFSSSLCPQHDLTKTAVPVLLAPRSCHRKC